MTSVSTHMLGTYMLGAFITPWIFWTGLGGVSVPIIIHLLAKRRFKRIRWAAMEFLLQAEKHNRRKINIRELILLALRCLAVLLLGLLLARPYLGPSGLADILGLGSTTERIFILDDSFSMSYTAGAKSTFDAAKESVLRLLAWVRSEAPGDRITILRTSDPRNPVLNKSVLDESELQRIRDVLEGFEPSHASAGFADLFAQLRSELADNPEQLNTMLYVVSDFQRRGWLADAKPQDALSSSPLAPFADWDSETKSLSISLIQVADEPRDNLAVTRIATQQPQLVATIENRLAIEIANFGSKPSQPFDLGVFLDDAAQPGVAVPVIPPGQTASVILSLTFPTDGYQGVRVEIPGDGVSIDNQRSVAYDVQPAIKVLLVNGEPASATIQDEVALLTTALTPEGDVFSGFQITLADESEIDTLNFGGFHVVQFANVYRLSEESVQRLENFVSAGGGLVLFLGDQVEAELYNDRLFKDGTGLLPCELGQVVRTPASQRAPSLVSDDWTHPLVKVFGGEENPFVASLAFWEYFDCVLPAETDEEGDISAETSNVIAAYRDDQRHPAIVEKALGAGRTVLFTSSCDLEWNNWAKSPSYVVTQLQLGQYLARESRAISGVSAGGVVHAQFETRAYQPRAILRTPRYPLDPEVEIAGDVSADDNSFEVVWPRADVVGIYSLALTTASGEVEQALFAVNPDPSESDLSGCDEALLRRSNPNVAFDYVTDVSGIIGSAFEGEREFAPAVLIAAVLILMLEQSLACWFGRH